jgi:hypothetical protein
MKRIENCAIREPFTDFAMKVANVKPDMPDVDLTVAHAIRAFLNAVFNASKKTPTMVDSEHAMSLLLAARKAKGYITIDEDDYGWLLDLFNAEGCTVFGIHGALIRKHLAETPTGTYVTAQGD